MSLASRRRRVILAAAIVCVVAAAAGCGGAQAPKPPNPKWPLTGTYTAAGVVTMNVGDQDSYVGQRLDRTWVIYRGCRNDTCRLRLARQTALTTEDAVIVRRGSRLVATFSYATPGCHHSRRTGLMTKRFTLRLKDAGRRIEATEAWYGTFPYCSSVPGVDGYISGTTSWTAVSVDEDCPALASGCFYGPTYPFLPPAHDGGTSI
jgi:hypothetical protein